MPLPPQPTALPTDADRLNGWKEIAAFLGKSVRTVQRWEREFSLPVHRLGGNGSEVVFAWRSEITEWTRSAAQARASAGTPPDGEEPSAASTARRAATRGAEIEAAPATRPAWALAPRWRAALATAALLAVSTALWIGWREGLFGAGDGPPASWRVADDRLTVLDSRGRTLWSHRFRLDLSEESYAPYAVADRDLPPPVRIEDIDGDGSREVLVAVKTLGVTRPSLYVFNADGSVRFSNGPPAVTLRFGETDYPPEWMVMGTWTTINSAHERSIWVLYYQKPHFPSLLTRLDTQGRVRSEYVSNGYIRIVREARWKGKDAVLITAINNESLGGSLAIFEGGEVRGSAPAENPKYRCENCPPGGPDHFLVFPRTCLSMWPGCLVPVSQAWVDTDDRVWAVAQHDRIDLRRPDQPAGAIQYGFDRNLALVRVELDGPFVRRHKELETAGKLDHALDANDAAKALPVRIWNGTHFEDLPAAPVEIAR
jgi:predicted DNA-binding transcriptional regulator AlpA